LKNGKKREFGENGENWGENWERSKSLKLSFRSKDLKSTYIAFASYLCC